VWEKLTDVTRDEMSLLRREKKARLYADEDVEEEVVGFLRDSGVNIKSARELAGHRGKDDSFHAAFAFKEKRFVLTKNAKHYLDDKAVAFYRLHGVIAIEGDMGNMVQYTRALLRVLELIPYGDTYTRMKISVSSSRLTFHFVDSKGRMTVQRFKLEGRDYYQWVE